MLLGIAFYVFYVGTINIVTAQNPNIQRNLLGNICCQTINAKGTCSGYMRLCFCGRTFLGTPDCLGLGVCGIAALPEEAFGDQIVIQLNSNFLMLIKADQERLRSLGKDYANTLADKLNEYETLIEKHGLKLSTKAALLDYYALLETEYEFEHFFTKEDLEKIKRSHSTR